MLVILDLILAGIITLSVLVVIANSKISGGTRAWIVVLDAWMIVAYILSAISLMGH